MQSLFLKYPELKDLLHLIRNEMEQAKRPADEVILNDEDVMRILKISKRKLQYLKSGLQIPFHTPTGGNRTYYLLSDILDWVKESRTESISNTRKF
jgi:hypothetical protein